MTKRLARWIGLAFLALAAIYLIAGFFQDVTFPGLPDFLVGSAVGTVFVFILAIILLPVLLVLVALRIAKNEKFSGAHAVAIIAILVVLGGLYWYADHREARSGPIAAGGSTPAPAPRLPPIKVTTAGHSKMCDMLHPVEDARQRQLAGCP